VLFCDVVLQSDALLVDVLLHPDAADVPVRK